MDLLMEPARESGCRDMEAMEEVIAAAARMQRSPVEDILDSGEVGDEDFLQALAKQLGFEWLDEVVRPENIAELREVCGPQVALAHRLLPVALEGEEGAQSLVLATYDPFNMVAKQAVARELDIPIRWKMTSRRRVYDALRALYGLGADTFEQILEGRDMDYENLENSDEANVIDADDDEEASVVKFVNQIIREALEQRATDIHVEPLASNLRIRYRIDGMLVDVTVPDNIKALQSAVIARLKIMSRLDIAEKRVPQDGRINLEFEGATIDVRVATVPTVEGESVSLRLLNQEKFNIARLGMEEYVLRKIRMLLALPNGIILITGPTGSGKSTSLYTFLSELNKPETRIVTIEDPVENKLEGVMQIAVKNEIGLSFATGLRSILRADPNVVMIGEIRDLETAEIAIRASLTGHLVFSTLHTNDSLGGISRLADMGVDPFLISAAVRAFLAQRLVRKLCEHCRVPRDIDPLEWRELGIPSEFEGQAYEAKGCDRCRNTGYAGRLAIYEIVILTEAMQEMVAQGLPKNELLVQAQKDGYKVMREYGWCKVLQGQTTIEEVISVTSSDLGGME